MEKNNNISPINDNTNKNNSPSGARGAISRRDFLKISGTAAAAVALASCKNNANSELGDVDPMGHHTDPVPMGKMTYRTNPNNNDRVSLLGYG